ncbi:YgaP family membrane protein [Halostagnicola bangensis]
MDRNVGGIDRLLRFGGGFTLLIYGYRNRETTIGTLAFIAGSDILATAIIQRCPINAVFGIDTCGEENW